MPPLFGAASRVRVPEGLAKILGDPARAGLRLLVLCDQPSATQDVHLFRPLRRLISARECAVGVVSEHSVEGSAGQAWFESVLRDFRPDAVIFSRFAGRGVGGLMAATRRSRVPVIGHLDDFLLQVPADLGADKVKRHNRPERVAALRHVLDEADLLYISTQPLAGALAQAGVTAPMCVAVLQSCADPAEMAAPPAADRGLCIGYQGTRNHRLDLEMIVPALCRVLDGRPAVRLELFGSIETPEAFTRFGERVTARPPAANGYEGFLESLKGLGWHIGLAPLRDTAFNSYRTYTKWTEYTVAGTVTVASAGVVYEDVIASDAGRLVADGDWEEALIHLTDDAILRHHLANGAQDRVRRSLNLAGMERQLLSMLRAADVRVQVSAA